VLASRDGTELFISEVQEKTFQREPMARLWSEHARLARESGRLAHELLKQGSAELPATDAAGTLADDHG